MRIYKALFLLFFVRLSIATTIIGSNFTSDTILVYAEYELYIDSIRSADIKHIANLPDSAFKIIPTEKKLTKPGEVYWLRFTINNLAKESIVIETPRDYRISELYIPTDSGFKKISYNIYKPWEGNTFLFNNPSFTIPYTENDKVFYLRISSDLRIGLGFVLYDTQFAHNKAMKKYIQIFLLLGIILIALIYNSVFLVRLRDRAYAYYLFYLISLLVFSLFLFGLSYPLLEKFTFRYYFFTIPFAAMTINMLLYVNRVLELKSKMPFFRKIIFFLIFVRIGILFIGIIFEINSLHNEYIDYICLFPAYVCCVIYIFKYRSNYSLILLLSMTLIFVGYTTKSVIKTFLPISDYELGQDNDFLFFIFTALEVIMLSIALSERYIQLKKENERSHLETIKYQEMALAESKEKEQLKEMLNRELETMVAQRTAELRIANETLREQAEEIEQINNMLKTDNEKLTSHVEELNKIRLLDKNMSFEEFKEIFPDDEKCFGFIAGLKWQNGYQCKKCGYKKFYMGYLPHSRKCKLCKYIESAPANTFLDNVKFPVQKALYILYYTYANPSPNIHKLAENIDLREATAHNFYKKIAEKTTKLKPAQKTEGDWTQLILS